MSLPDWQYNAQLIATITPTPTVIGTYLGMENGLAVVNCGWSSIAVPIVGKFRPRPNDAVVLTWSGRKLRLTGPNTAREAYGIVTVAGNPYMTVNVEGQDYRLPFETSYTPHVGDTVSIDWNRSCITGAVSANPLDPTPPPRITTQQRPFKKVFLAKQSGSFSTKTNTWWTRDLYCDSHDSAGWFYGPAIHHSIRDDAYIESVEIWLPAYRTVIPKDDSKAAIAAARKATPKLGRHSDSSEQPGGVSLNDGFTLKHRTGWVSLPVEWAQSWRSNPGGVAISGDDSVYEGIGVNSHSGKIRIRGRQ